MTSPHPAARALTIGKLAAAAEVSANAVRFYEREGLMKVPAKTGSGYRVYGPEAVQRLRFIKQAQHCGFTLQEVQTLLRLREQASGCCNDVRSKVVEKKLQLEARIAAMKAMSASLDQLIVDCTNEAGPLRDCSILASLDQATPAASP